MKRLSILFILSASLLAGLYAQERLAELSPKDPRSMALGGTFVALSSGYQSFFGNPAGFADGEREFTLVNANPWIYVSPTTSNIATLQAAAGATGPDLVNALNELITTNGIGAGASAGLGWVGKGLGIGLNATVDSYVWGKNALGAVGGMDAQISAVLGVGFPVKLFGLNLLVGGDVRPYLRMTGPISSTQLAEIMTGGSIDAILTGVPVDLGFGLAMDLGARLDLGRLLSIGLAVRDISTEQRMSSSSFGEVLDYLGQGDLPPSSQDSSYPVLPDITFGAALRPLPASIAPFIDLLVLLELQDPIGVIADNQTFWQLLHAGVETEFLNGLFALRAGLNKGYISFGFGLELLALKFNAALFTEEMGLRPGDRPRTGVSADFALRF
jgi:hypothetical protein